MPKQEKPEVYKWKFIDYFLTIAIAVMPYFAFILIFIKRPKNQKIRMLIIGLIGFGILFALLQLAKYF